jgi:hypothetical protein
MATTDVSKMYLLKYYKILSPGSALFRPIEMGGFEMFCGGTLKVKLHGISSCHYTEIPFKDLTSNL